ncbi:hypothetical protein ACJMK2_033649, partial [Sinanodonta woodiana]
VLIGPFGIFHKGFDEMFVSVISLSSSREAENCLHTMLMVIGQIQFSLLKTDFLQGREITTKAL